MQQQHDNTTPFNQVKSRLLQNKMAIFGGVIIVFAFFVALLGYVIMPDDTPNANGGAQQIRKQLPGFEVDFIKFRKQREVDKVSFIEYVIYGQESEYTIEPFIGEYSIRNDSVIFVPFPGVEKDKETGELKTISEHMLKIVKVVYNSPSEKLTPNTGTNFEKRGNTFYYLDGNEVEQSITQEKLEQEFKEKCVTHRKYWLGTNISGRDMLSLLIFGTRISLLIGFMSVLISLFLGITLGAIAGFFGGLIDNLINWFMTVTWSIPNIMLVIIISVLINKGLWVVFIAVGLTMWVEIARIVRTEIMSIKEKLFVEAARAFGYSNRRIIFKHILPNVIGPIVVIATNNFALAILIEAGLSFLGFGVQPPMPSWGMMVNEGFDVIATKNSWHLVLLPSLAISLMVLAFNLFGNGLRDAYDPKSLK